MTIEREAPTATLLDDGRVLAIGGINRLKDLSGGPDLFDLATGVWTPTSDPVETRGGQRAVLLQDGRVLVVGGRNVLLRQLAMSETYDPVADVCGRRLER